MLTNFNLVLLSKITPLLDKPNCRLTALQAYAAITSVTCRQDRVSLAYKAPRLLLPLLQEHNSDPKLAELCAATLCQSAEPILLMTRFTSQPTQDHRSKAKILETLKMLVIHMKKPTASLLLLDSAHKFISSATRHCDDELREEKSSLDWLIASLLSRFHLRRILTIGALCSFDKSESRDSWDNDERLMKKLVAHVDGISLIPKHISDLLAAYGSTSFIHSDIALNRDFKGAMEELERTHDYHACGIRVAKIFLLTDSDIKLDGSFNPSSGLGVTQFVQALVKCVRVLLSTKSDDNTHQDLADVIMANILMSCGRPEEVYTLALRAVERGTQYPYFYFILCLYTKDHSESLRLAKKGLRFCPRSTRTSSVNLRMRVKAGTSHHRVWRYRLSLYCTWI